MEAEAALVWRWEVGEHRRYAIESEVVAPNPLWFYASRNAQARVIAWQVRVLVDCVADAASSKRSLSIRCNVDDLGVMAAAMPGDQATARRAGLLTEILPEVDQRVTGATIELSLRRDGRLEAFGLVGLPNRERREGLMAENVRIVLSRAFAAFELPLPRSGAAEGGVWAHSRNVLFQAPTLIGTVGSAAFVNRATFGAEGLATIESAGRGVSQIGEGGITLSMEHHGTAVFDVAGGGLVERTWDVTGTPTASSAGNEGTRAPDYHQYGHLVRLAPGESFDVGETVEVDLPDAPTSLTVDPGPALEGAIPVRRKSW